MWLMVAKDLSVYGRDRAALLLGFVLPVALVTVAGFIAKFAFGGAGGLPRVTLWVSDSDQTPISNRFVEALRAVEMLEIKPRVGDSRRTLNELRRFVTEGEIHHLLVIESGFENSLTEFESPQLTMIRDPDRTMEDRAIRIGVLEALLVAIGDRFGPNQSATLRQALSRTGLGTSEIDQLLNAAEVIQDSLGISSEDLFPSKQQQADAELLPAAKSGLNESDPAATANVLGRMLDAVPIHNEDIVKPGGLRKYPFHYAQAVSGITVMMVMLGLMVCSTTLIHERDSGTLSRLMVMAVPRSSIFWGKYAFSLVVGLVQLSLFFVYGNFIFRIDAFRDPLTLLVLCVTWTVACTSLGMLIAVSARTVRQAETLTYILVLIMAGLGGCWIPKQIMNLPANIELLTRFMVTNWAMAGFQGMFWDQLSWTHPRMLTAIGIQWAFALAISAAAFWLYRRQYQHNN
jgi:ABC-type transport system involved in multi-copper enzyme maturation permease subunit